MDSQITCSAQRQARIRVYLIKVHFFPREVPAQPT